MKRRRVLQSLVAVPAAAAAAQSAAPLKQAADELPKLTTASIEPAAAGMPGFFSKAQYEALAKLSDAIMPRAGGRPSATQASVPEFLDFLVGQSPAAVQELYREGLDRLAGDGVNEQALAALHAPWSYAGPSDRYAQFLQRAKTDILQATVSSREWAESLGRGRRGSTPSGYYWRSLE